MRVFAGPAHRIDPVGGAESCFSLFDCDVSGKEKFSCQLGVTPDEHHRSVGRNGTKLNEFISLGAIRGG
jgi:hypothetical protein